MFDTLSQKLANLIFRFLLKNAPDPDKLNVDKINEVMPEDKNVDKIYDMEYPNQDGGTLKMDIYWRKDLKDVEKPVMIMLHGGGLFAGNTKMSRGIAENFAEQGFLVFVPEYRLIDQADICGEVRDVQSGFRFIRDNLEKYHGSKNQILLVSESAGALLAVYSLAAEKSEVIQRLMHTERSGLGVKALCCLSGMFYTRDKDFIGWLYPKKLYGAHKNDPEFLKYMNPEEKEVLDTLPPTFLVTSLGDFLKGYTLYFADTMKKRGKTRELLYYSRPQDKKLGHAFPAIAPALPESREVASRVTEWFNKL